MINEYLLKSKRSKSPISIYTDIEDTDSFSFGYIQKLSDEWVILASITPYGLYDGFILKKRGDIYRCEYGDKYGAKVYKLYEIRSQKHPEIDLPENELLRDILKYAYNNRFVISIEIQYSKRVDLQGLVSELQNSFLKIVQIDEYGTADGETVVNLEDITCISCDSENERVIKLLFDCNIK